MTTVGGALPVTGLDVLAALAAVLAVVLVVRSALAPRGPKAAWARSVLITGGASRAGIGYAIATQAAASGVARIVLLDMDGDGATEAAAALVAAYPGVRALGLRCDVSDGEAVAAAVRQASDFCGGEVDVVVSNAGVVRGRDLDQLTAAEVQTTLGVNLMAAFHLARAVLPGWKSSQRQRCFVVTASMMGLVGGGRMVDYIASKWGLVGFAEGMRMELARDGLASRIPVVVLCPYVVRCGTRNESREGVQARGGGGGGAFRSTPHKPACNPQCHVCLPAHHL
jgi:NAD(P)-dependent dehydrogenase (short-subunit alcohol dehydrogenase family)